MDPQLNAETFYWEGEILFGQGEYDQAAAAYAKFSTTPGSYLSELHNDADYARGYAHYKSEKYTDALSAFRAYLESTPDDDPARMRDAELRAADCFFALKSFNQAAEYYDRVLERDVEPLDYALFQRAMSAKLDQDLEGQTARLEQLLEAYPNSRLVVEALFQAGRTHIELNQLADAESKFLSLIEQHSATPRAKQALVELCLVGVKLGQDDKVLALWDRIRTEYGNDNVASDAYNIVEPLLIERGLLSDLPAAVGLDGDAIEQRIFESASFMALENRCAEAIPRLKEYLRQYPAGPHFSEAQFYSATVSLRRTAQNRHTWHTWRCWPCQRANSRKPRPLVLRPLPGIEASTGKPWVTTNVSQRSQPCKATSLKQTLVKCDAITCWDRKQRPRTSRHA